MTFSHHFNSASSNLQLTMGKISEEDRHLIKNLRLEKKWGARKMIKEFPNKPWKRSSLNKFIQKLDTTGSILRTSGSGRPRTMRTPVIIELVQQLMANEDNSHSPRMIARETLLSHSTVRRIIKMDLRMNVL
jgi:DNA invertase Pin-like site-specific DNA recombinase